MLASPQAEASKSPASADEFPQSEATNNYTGTIPNNYFDANDNERNYLNRSPTPHTILSSGLIEHTSSSANASRVTDSADSANSVPDIEPEIAKRMIQSNRSTPSEAEDAENMLTLDTFMKEHETLLSVKRNRRADDAEDFANDSQCDKPDNPSRSKTVEKSEKPDLFILPFFASLGVENGSERMNIILEKNLDYQQKRKGITDHWSAYSDDSFEKRFKSFPPKAEFVNNLLDELKDGFLRKIEKQINAEEEQLFWDHMKTLPIRFTEIFSAISHNRDPNSANSLAEYVEIYNAALESFRNPASYCEGARTGNSMNLLNSPSPTESMKNSFVAEEAEVLNSNLENNHVPKVLPQKNVNPRILLLDFETSTKDNIRIVNNILRDYTQIRKYSLKLLTKGGISILFSSEQAKKMAEPILITRLGNKLKVKGFMKSKKLFEIITCIPKQVDREELKIALDADRFIERFGNKVVFFMKTLESARGLINDGFFFNDFFLTFELFVFKPKIGCRTCGSLDHSNCVAEETNMDASQCYHCSSTEHSSFKCAIYLDILKEAKENKKQSYAAALLCSSSSQKTQKKIPMDSSSRINQRSSAKKSSPTSISPVDELNVSLITTVVKSVLLILNVSSDIDVINAAIRKSLSEVITNQNSASSNTIDEKTWPSLNKNNSNNPSIYTTAIKEKNGAMLVEEPVAATAQCTFSSKVLKPLTSLSIKEKLKTTKKSLSWADHEGHQLSHIRKIENRDSEKKTSRYAKPISEKASSMDVIETDTDLEMNNDDALNFTYGKAFCRCGHPFKVSSGSKSHLTRKIACCDYPGYVCECKAETLDLSNWTSNFGLFKKHLKSKCIAYPTEDTDVYES